MMHLEAVMADFAVPDFANPQGLIQAMTHKSFIREGLQEGGDNERLEFLGDAILTFLCGEFLYREYPHYAEGELTALRASLVDKAQLAAFANWLGLGASLRLGKGVENSGGRTNPRLLCSAFEALLGAYYLDQGSNLKQVRHYVEPFFRAALNNRGATPAILNEKSQLQEWALAHQGAIPCYEIVAESGPDHAKQFVAEVFIAGRSYGRGQGGKKQTAEKQAARAALEALDLL